MSAVYCDAIGSKVHVFIMPSQDLTIASLWEENWNWSRRIHVHAKFGPLIWQFGRLVCMISTKLNWETEIIMFQLGTWECSKYTTDYQILNKRSLYHEIHSLDSQSICLQSPNLLGSQIRPALLLVSCQHRSKECFLHPTSAGKVPPQNVSGVRKVCWL